MPQQLRRLIPVAQCPPGQGRFVEADGRRLAVFHLVDPDRFAVIDNDCPHAGGPLHTGELTGCTVVCPMHHLEFDVTTGRGPPREGARVNSYPVLLKDGFVYADLGRPL